MKRTLLIIAALSISNIAAWLLLAAASPFLAFAIDPAGTSLKSSLSTMLYLGPVYVLIGFLPLSILASLLGLMLRRHSRKDCIVGGMLTGFGFYLSFGFLFGFRDSSAYILGLPIGAICGWTYWCIALHSTGKPVSTRREVLGVIAVSVAAPYLGAMSLLALMSAPSLTLSDFVSINVGRILWAVYFLGSIGIIKYGFAIVITSFVTSVFMRDLAVSSLAITSGVYSFLGMCFGLHFIISYFPKHLWLLPSFLIAGAICGWIYWCIAIRQTPETSRPITTS